MTIFEINIFWIQIAPTYYWLMYGLSFLFTYLFIKNTKLLNEKELDNLIFFGFLWVILWGRLWYILFYNLDYYISNLSEILKVWKWGMSFHWWFLWVIIAIFVFSKIYKKDFFELSDNLALPWAIWIWFWRIWNYLNSELFWFEYYWFLAMEISWKSYFPSPLLEAFLEWLLLFLILFYLKKREKITWIISWYFMVWYWFFRIISEFFRLPDKHIWYLFLDFVTMWQVLSIPIIIGWILLILYRKNAFLN